MTGAVARRGGVAALLLALGTGVAMGPAGAGTEPPDASGGAATSYEAPDQDAFGHPSANMGEEGKLDFLLGNALFSKLWASAPSSTTASDGLGPLYNARSCRSCHLNDGPGRVPGPDEIAVSLFLRLSVPPHTAEERATLDSGAVSDLPEPTYGLQLQNRAIRGFDGEGRMTVAYDEVAVALAGGEVVHLRRPSYGVADLAFGPMAADVMLSPRIALPMVGLGLLEAIPEDQILAHADPDDRDGDGIRGVANRIGPEHRLGRFGWKAGQPDVPAQTAAAFAGDIGLSTPLIPASHGDCTARQTACRAAPTGDDPAEGVEVTRQMFDLVVHYTRNLAVPARRGIDRPEVTRGEAVFATAGCAACHVPRFVTGANAADPILAGQVIRPYTDLLLHDMGEGLADGRPEARATGRQWRTPPLWGIGLTAEVAGRTEFLHDGRARGLLEAILWHGGEAEAARDRVVALSPDQRRDLIAFLNSL